jgi:hypothetical protein
MFLIGRTCGARRSALGRKTAVRLSRSRRQTPTDLKGHATSTDSNRQQGSGERRRSVTVRRQAAVCRNGRRSPPGIRQPRIGTLPGLRCDGGLQAGQEGQRQVFHVLAGRGVRTRASCRPNCQRPMADTVVIGIFGVSRVVVRAVGQPGRIDAATMPVRMQRRAHLVDDKQRDEHPAREQPPPRRRGDGRAGRSGRVGHPGSTSDRCAGSQRLLRFRHGAAQG